MAVDEHFGGDNEQDRARISKPSGRPYRFTGKFSYSLDAKGRLVIPGQFREKLGETFWIAPAHDFSAIALYSEDQYDMKCEKYDRLEGKHPDIDKLIRLFYEMSYGGQSCDSQGRVLLPTVIRDFFLKDQKDVYVSGVNNYVRVVSAVKDDAESIRTMETLPQTLLIVSEYEAGDKKSEGRSAE